ncbi:MAG: hypothetical protein U1F36_22525 [Planctomycetota bacterium]
MDLQQVEALVDGLRQLHRAREVVGEPHAARTRGDDAARHLEVGGAGVECRRAAVAARLPEPLRVAALAQEDLISHFRVHLKRPPWRLVRCCAKARTNVGERCFRNFQTFGRREFAGSRPSLAWQCAHRQATELSGGQLVLLGFGPAPLYVTLQQLRDLVYVRGASGSGKTTRFMSMLIEQLMRLDQLVICIDCKGDMMLYAHMHHASRSSGRRLRFFSLMPTLPSDFVLDMFPALLKNRTPHQVAELLAGSLNLQSTEPFFTEQNVRALEQALTQALAHGAVTWDSLARQIRTLVGTRNLEHAQHALNVVDRLAQCAEINPGSPATAHLPALDIEDALLNGHPLYLCLPGSTESSMTSSSVAALLLKLIISVARDLVAQRRMVRQMFVAIDEFQDLASGSDIQRLVGQVRGVGGGISLILSHQVEQQIADEGLRALLLSFGIVAFFSPRHSAKTIIEWSGEQLVYLRSKTVSKGGSTSSDGGSSISHSVSETMSPHIRPRVDNEFVQSLNRIPGAGFLVIGGGTPTAAFFPHHVSMEEARARVREVERMRDDARRRASTERQRALQRGASLALPSTIRKTSATPQAALTHEALHRLFEQLRRTTLVSVGRAP